MTAAEQKLFDSYTRLAEMAATSFNRRRAYEWKILLGFWAIMLMAIYKDIRLPQFGLCALAIIVALFLSTWISGVWAANSSDKSRYEYYQKLAHDLLAKGKATDVLPDPPRQVERADFMRLGFFWDWNTQFQIIGTVAIALLLYFSQTEPVQVPVSIPAPMTTRPQLDPEVPPPVPGPESWFPNRKSKRSSQSDNNPLQPAAIE